MRPHAESEWTAKITNQLLYAISALMRNSDNAQRPLLTSADGLDSLAGAFDAHAGDVSVRVRVITLLTDILENRVRA